MVGVRWCVWVWTECFCRSMSKVMIATGARELRPTRVGVGLLMVLERRGGGRDGDGGPWGKCTRLAGVRIDWSAEGVW